MIYLIQKVCFDYLENDSDRARRTIDIGFTSSKEKVEKYTSKNKLVTRKEWDGNHYPYYKITEIEELEID